MANFFAWPANNNETVRRDSVRRGPRRFGRGAGQVAETFGDVPRSLLPADPHHAPADCGTTAGPADHDAAISGYGMRRVAFVGERKAAERLYPADLGPAKPRAAAFADDDRTVGRNVVCGAERAGASKGPETVGGSIPATDVHLKAREPLGVPLQPTTTEPSAEAPRAALLAPPGKKPKGSREPGVAVVHRNAWKLLPPTTVVPAPEMP